MKNVRIVYCAKDVVPVLDLSKVALVVAYTYHNQALCEEKSIPYINAYYVHEVFQDVEYRQETLDKIISTMSVFEDCEIVVHCEYGRVRSHELAHILAKYFGLDSVERAFVYNNELRFYKEDTSVTSSLAKSIYKLISPNAVI